MKFHPLKPSTLPCLGYVKVDDSAWDIILKPQDDGSTLVIPTSEQCPRLVPPFQVWYGISIIGVVENQ